MGSPSGAAGAGGAGVGRILCSHTHWRVRIRSGYFIWGIGGEAQLLNGSLEVNDRLGMPRYSWSYGKNENAMGKSLCGSSAGFALDGLR